MIRREQYGPDDVLQAVRRRLWSIVVPLGVALLGAVFYARSLPNRFDSEVRIQLVPASVSEKIVPSAVASTLEARLPAITEMVLNGERLRRIVNELKLYPFERAGAGGDSVTRLRHDFQVRVATPDSFVLTYAAPDARTAMAVAVRLGDAFIDENRRRSEAVAGAATNFLDAQLDDARGRLQKYEVQLAEFNRKNAGELPSQLASNLQLLQAAQTQLQAVREALSRDADEALAIDRAVEEAEASSGSLSDASQASVVTAMADARSMDDNDLSHQLQAAVRELAELQTRLKPEHPDVARLIRRVADLQAQVRANPSVPQPAAPAPSARRISVRERVAQGRVARERLTRQMASRRAEEARLAQQIEDYKRRIDVTPGRQAEIAALMRDYDTLKDLYSKLLTKKEEARVSANLQENDIGEQFVLVSPATLPARPSSPNRLQLEIVGTLSGLLLGIGLAALLEYRDTAIRTEQDLTAGTGLRLLAAIPWLTALGRRPRKWPVLSAGRLGLAAGTARRSLASVDLPPAARDQYQKLATSLHHAQAGRGMKVLVVASAFAGEGKTLTAANLAVTLSRSFKRRVLLVEADFRRPAVHDLFELPLSPGLAEALKAGAVSAAAPSISITLSVLPAGKASDPIAALSSTSLPTFIDRASGMYDWVVFDTPPVGLLSDAKLVAAHADAVIVVVDAGHTPCGAVLETVAAFGRDKVLGVVLNRAEDRVVTGGYRNSYYEYYGRNAARAGR